jgi:hypothetical protein
MLASCCRLIRTFARRSFYFFGMWWCQVKINQVKQVISHTYTGSYDLIDYINTASFLPLPTLSVDSLTYVAIRWFQTIYPSTIIYCNWHVESLHSSAQKEHVDEAKGVSYPVTMTMIFTNSIYLEPPATTSRPFLSLRHNYLFYMA